MALVFSYHVIRGFRVYKDVWQPQIDEILICVRESTNLHNPFALLLMLHVAVTKGHGHKLGVKISCGLN